MARLVLGVLSFIVLFIFSVTSVNAHPGKTASDGCHYCRTNCDKWGVPWNERHCHGGVSNTNVPPQQVVPTPVIQPTNKSTLKPTIKPTVKPTTKSAIMPNPSSTPTFSPQPSSTSQPSPKGQTKARRASGFWGRLMSLFGR